MTFAYNAGPDAVKGLQTFHDKGEKVAKNALEKLEGVILPEFYKKASSRCRNCSTPSSLNRLVFCGARWRQN